MGGRTVERRPGSGVDRLQGLVDVGNQVGSVFDTDRQADKPGIHRGVGPNPMLGKRLDAQEKAVARQRLHQSESLGAE